MKSTTITINKGNATRHLDARIKINMWKFKEAVGFAKLKLDEFGGLIDFFKSLRGSKAKDLIFINFTQKFFYLLINNVILNFIRFN